MYFLKKVTVFFMLFAIFFSTLSGLLMSRFSDNIYAETTSYSDTNNPKELLLGMFFNSETDCSDTIYVSFDGTTFEAIMVPFQDRAPDDSKDRTVVDPYVTHIQALKCPSLQYHDGVFWTMVGMTTTKNGTGVFLPQLSYSTDLVNWSYPNAGGSTVNTNTFIKLTTPTYDRNGNRAATTFDCAAPELFIDDDGTGWIVVCLGYFGNNHNDPNHDHMAPYIIRVDNLKPGTTDKLTTKTGRETMPLCRYSDAYPVNLEGMTSDDYIDASMYKENGKYYLCIKRDAKVNEIWTTDKLSLSSKWTKIADDVAVGSEAPCLTYFNGKYLLYTDKLSGNTFGNAEKSSRGTFVTESSNISGTWRNTRKIVTKTIDGKIIPNRHGFVLKVTDTKAISVIMDIYRKAKNGTNTPEKDDSFTGIRKTWGTYRLYKNGRYDNSYEGLKKAPDGKYYYFCNGIAGMGYTGVAKDESGRVCYVTDGVFDTSFSGMVRDNKNLTSDDYIYIANGVKNNSYSGIALSPQGNLCYIKAGKFDTSFTGLAYYKKDGNWYFVNKGYHNAKYTGAALATTGNLCYVKNGLLDTTYTGVAPYQSETYYFKNGRNDKGFTGIAKRSNGEWGVFIRKGRRDTSYTGVALSIDGKWRYCYKGYFSPSYSGVVQSITGNWVYVKNGQFNTSFTGVARSTTGNWIFVKNGRFTPSFTGVALSTTGNWIFVRNGRVSEGSKNTTGVARSITGNYVYVYKGYFTDNYTGLARSITTGDIVFVTKGRYDTKYNGSAIFEGKTYTVKNGRAVK